MALNTTSRQDANNARKSIFFIATVYSRTCHERQLTYRLINIIIYFAGVGVRLINGTTDPLCVMHY
jgi:hypothetical protein